jgi:type VI secretion system protein ImpG
MSETLFPYYERELGFIRELAQDFARQYPAAAGRLLLEPNRSGDPHIERLIESFAIIAGRIHHKLDDEFPELTDALLGILYPHYLAPVPSMGVVQFELDAARGDFPDGFVIDRFARMNSRPVGNLPCKFRTGYPVTLWPAQLTMAQLKLPPFPPGLQPPRRTAAALRLQFQCEGKATFPSLSLDKMRLYISGENHIVANLYDLIFNACTQVVFRPLDEGSKIPPLVLSPKDCLTQVGFESDEHLLSYPRQAFEGYSLLSEFFAFPNKFHFLDLGGWKRACKHGFLKKLEVVLFLDRTVKGLDEWVDLTTFWTGATPIVNLFEQTAEPIQLNRKKYEYRIVPDVAHPLGTEIYSVESVSSTDSVTGKVTDYHPFYSFKHGKTRHNQQTFWFPARTLSSLENDRGTDMYLRLVDQGFNPAEMDETTLVVRTLCTNRNLPMQLQHAGDKLYFSLESAAPLAAVRCLRTPTAPLRPRLKRGAYWGLISHLSLNHLSLADPVEGRLALQEILRLYDFSDPEAGQQQLSDVTRQLIGGITGLRSRRVVGRIKDELSTGFCRGIELTLELDEQKYVGTGVYLFASVLERFFGLYASINSFSQLIAKTSQSESYFKKWPPRTAEQQLL